MSKWSVETREIQFRDWTTWVRVSIPAEPDPDAHPVVVLHGGPGVGHNYLLPLEQWAAEGRTVIHYDQLGCGMSTHLPEAEPIFWAPDLFIEEFNNLISALALERFHIVGQSWGGMLGAEIAITRPQGLTSLSICNSPASMELWLSEASRLRTLLPEGMDERMREFEASGDTDNPEYVACADEFYRRHVCNVEPAPPELAASNAQVEEDPTVYHTMNGPNEFHVIGTLRDWSVINRVDAIEAPCLVLAGEFDEATPATWQPFVEHIPDVRSVVMADCSHCAHLEQTDEFLHLVGGFMRDQERN